MAGVFWLCAVMAAVLSAGVRAVAVPSDMKGPKDLSDEEHYVGDGHEHNPEYDHDAFLGQQQAQTFDQLAPEEAKRRLGIIVGRVDVDSDGQVTEEELVNWVRHVTKKYVYDDVDRHWGYHDGDNNRLISWDEYKESAYGMVEKYDEIHDHHRNLTYTQVLERDKRRFSLADRNGDKILDREEFADFLHPQEAMHMREVVVDETMMDMDKDQNGFVELEEYINDLWPAYERAKAEVDPDWVVAEREQFHKHRDKDGDGKLDRKELGDWILPEEFDHAEAEARHLIFEADTNKDKVLSKAEILDHQDLFVGSQATDFGDYLIRHDEF